MKKIIKKLILLVQTTCGIIEWLLRRILLGGWTYSTPRPSNMRKLRVLANGPTLLDELASAKKCEADYLMLNDSVLTEAFFKTRPSRYILIDPLYFTRDISLLSSFEKVDWEIILFVPVTCLKEVRKLLSANNNISVFPIPSGIPVNIRLKSVRNFFFRHYLASPPLQNVVVGAVYTAIFSGYRDIELYGVSHSWTSQLVVNDRNQVCLRDAHYYEKDAPLKPWLQCNGEPYRMHEILKDLSQMFESYWDIQYFADTIGGIRIVNKTKDSFIDAFDREYD